MRHHRVPHRSKGNRDADVHAGKSGRRHFRGAYGNALHNVYEGIFEKDFTLFYGEKMVCMIHEEKDGKKTQSGPFTLFIKDRKMPEDNDMQSRYGMLNEMCRAFVQKKGNGV